jgi:hypothetical protein
VEFLNHSGVEAGWTLGFESDGRELLIIAVKATYNLPASYAQPTLAEEQVKLTTADEFTGEAGRSAPLREADFSHRKRKCDVVLNGSAWAPGGRSARSVEVALRVASLRKSFFVFGDRRWQDRWLSSNEPEPFETMPISYDRAYGGVDTSNDDPPSISTYKENPVGVGYYPIHRHAPVGSLLPNTADRPSPISDPDGRHRPMSLGPVGRNFFPRYQYAGTYDRQWLENHAPFWPADFNEAYFQCTPSDQQVPFLRGGEEVELHNLTTDGWRRFYLPTRSVPITFLPYRAPDIRIHAVCDTLILEPDRQFFTMTWRASLPLRRSVCELRQAIAGEMPCSWRSRRRALTHGKKYYANLRELIDANRARQLGVAPRRKGR